jgi:hypothetical protein
MIGEQRPGKALRIRLQQECAKSTLVVIIVRSVTEDLASLNTSGDDVVQCAGRVYAGLSWHVGGCSMVLGLCKCENMKGVIY